MKIRWLAHASFLIESQGLRIITDPYQPEATGYHPVVGPADIVIRSSATDIGHCYVDLIQGEPRVVTATDIGSEQAIIPGLTITAIPAQESLVHKERPLDNAMYRFTLEGIR